MSMRMCEGAERELNLPEGMCIMDGGPSCSICIEKGPYACETGTLEITPWDLGKAKDTYKLRAELAEAKIKQLEREIEELLKNLKLER